MTTPAATTVAADPWEMALIHRLIRRGFEQGRQAVLAPGADRRTAAVAEYLGFHLVGLHAHHSSEDELLWPLLLDRAVLSGALIRRMEDQHAGLHDALDTTRNELDQWTATPTPSRAQSLGVALETVSDRLATHLAEEERDIVPLIAVHVTQAEWDHLGKVAFAKFTPRQRFVAMGELLAAADHAEATRMLAGLPAPIKLLWALVGRRRYERLMSGVGGSGTRPGAEAD